MQLNSTAIFDQVDTIRNYHNITIQYSNVLRNVFEKYRYLSIHDYLRMIHPNINGSYQKRDDLVDIVYRYTQKLLGDSIALLAADEFSKDPIVLTANHHGVDYFSHSFQASLLFYLYRRFISNSLTTVPVFSCGSIPLNNATFPQGMLFYSVSPEQICTVPIKLPIFPDRLKRQLVCNAQPIDKEMLERAEKRLDKMVRERTIPSNLKDVAVTILNQDYSDFSVIEQSSYSDQAVLLNNKIWKRIFHSESAPTELIYLEIEKIVEQVLRADLRNENSLIHKILFEPMVREAVLHELDGVRACWDLNQLKKQALLRQLNTDGSAISKRSGTIFFWGINEYGKRIPLYLVASGINDASFIGIDDHNNLFEIAYSPEQILAGLNDNRLLPSLFTCYLVISLARGVRLIGGYFQGEYLPKMQQGVVNALRRVSEYHDVATQIEQIQSNFYLSGMLTVMAQIESRYLVPAGPAEIIARGGLTNEDQKKILSIKIQDAHVASLLETMPDFISGLLKSSDWKRQIAKQSLRELEGSVLIK